MEVLRRGDLVGVLAWVHTVATALMVVTLLAPPPDAGPLPPRVALTLLTGALAVALWRTHHDRPRWLGDVGLVWLELVVLGAIALDPDAGSAGFLHVLLVWVGVLSFGFLPRRRAWFHAVTVTAVAAATWAAAGAVAVDVVVAAAILLGTVAGVGVLVAHLVERAERIAHVDELTGVANRRGVLRLLDDPGSGRSPVHGQLLVLDLDDFKAVNDTAGHAAGDALLREAAQAWRAVLSPRDALGRLGGDEFVVALHDADPGAAAVVAERLRAVTPGPVTVSVGASRRAPGEPLHVALARADASLYAAKRARTDERTAPALR